MSGSPSSDAPLYSLNDCTFGFTFVLTDALSHVAQLRKNFCRLAASMDLGAQDTDDLEVIIGELAANAARHARGGSYRVNIDCAPQQIIISVIDHGEGFSPDGVAEPGTVRFDLLAEESAGRVGGFGLPMFRLLADQVEITANSPPEIGMTVRVIKQLRRLKNE